MLDNYYNVKDIKLVDIRKYNGIENGMLVWTFLGYDFVKKTENGKVISILNDEVKYDYLNKNKDGSYDYQKLVVGDIKAVEVGEETLGKLGFLPVVSKRYIESWIVKHPELYFINYHEKEKVKVKKINDKK